MLIRLFLLIFIFISPVSAKDIFLTKITTDYVKKTYSLYVEVNEANEITAIKTINDQKKKTKIYKTNVLDKEITLVKAVGVTLVSLKCNNFNPQKGCDIVIEYPYNLTYGKFKSFNAKLMRIENDWNLVADNRVFRKMHLVAKKLLGLLIGIKKIETDIR